MILHLINKIIRNRTRKITFPKLASTKFNKLWKVSHIKLTSISIIELIPIIKNLIFRFGPSSLVGIPAIFYIIKSSGILEEKDTKDHLKMYKALNVDNNNLEKFVTVSLIFSIIIKLISITIWLFWLPLKIVILFYILDYLNYDVAWLYYKLNNLTIGILDFYYRTLIDFIESLRYKYDFYIINNEHIPKI